MDIPGVAPRWLPVCPPGTWLLSEAWKSSLGAGEKRLTLVSPFHICFPESVSWLRPGRLPRGSWRETAFELQLDRRMNLPSPFSLPPRTMIAFLMRILFKKYSLYFPPPPRICFLLSPFPFFPSSELHVLLVTSHGWRAAWFFLLPWPPGRWLTLRWTESQGGQHVGWRGQGLEEEVSRGR